MKDVSQRNDRPHDSPDSMLFLTFDKVTNKHILKICNNIQKIKMSTMYHLSNLLWWKQTKRCSHHLAIQNMSF